jgi:hypothetical protein
MIMAIYQFEDEGKFNLLELQTLNRLAVGERAVGVNFTSDIIAFKP